ncbi:MAG: glycosyltransferase family 4 protein [Myxococcota bacterium]|nr:glycosyltransferase family 4 protein [Myxococcota bacterium]
MRVVINLVALPAYSDRLKLICSLSEHVEHVTLLTDRLPPDIEARVAPYANLTVVELGAKSFSQVSSQWLEEALARTPIDVVHDTFGFLAPFFQRHGPNPSRRFRLLTTLYTSNWDWFQDVRRVEFDISWTYAKQRILTLWRDRRMCPMADRVMVLGPGHAKTLADAHDIPPDRVIWCPAEVDTDLYTPGENPTLRTASLTFSGAVCRNKGVDVLLDAAAILASAGEDFVVKLIGRVLFWERRWFAQARRDHDLENHVIHYGQRRPAELLAHYRQSTLFVFPSRFEGSPRCVREALACGLPCIVSDIPGHRGLDPDGQFLTFVPDWNPHTWAEAIQQALAESEPVREARRIRGRQHMVHHHSVSAVAHRWCAQYEAICAAPPWSASRK